MNAGFDGDELCAALDDETRVEAISLVHLESQSTEIAQPFLAHQEQRLAFASKLPGCRRGDGRHRLAGRPAVFSLSRHGPRLELKDDEPFLGHLANGVGWPFARVSRILDAAVGHLVGAERRSFVDGHSAELESLRGA